MCFIAIKKETPSIHSCELNEEWNINNLPNQIMVKAISDGFVFNILCVDETTCSNSSLFYIFILCKIRITSSTLDFPCFLLPLAIIEHNETVEVGNQYIRAG
ncbi:unnamed protein product [Rotaria magnacalcarata]|uniref:Uncharacterized protein n=1 Tax=Rotaria magnacalcarata TaxID=392030 RepID=A0A8S2P8X5_9BILA|nr:unnamed protein product [Rotaria magnacalcarata]